MEAELLTRAEFARQMDVSKMAVTKWVQRGWVRLVDGKIDADQAKADLQRFRANEMPAMRPTMSPTLLPISRQAVVRLLRALDDSGLSWHRRPDSERLPAAAAAVGMTARAGARQDDLGGVGWELHGLASRTEASRCIAGEGFTLNGAGILELCRLHVDPGTAVSQVKGQVKVCLELVPALARPYASPVA